MFGTSEAFARTWEELAERHELRLDRRPDPEPVRGSRSVAVILHCAGREEEALDLLQAAFRAGIESPLVVGSEPDHRLAVSLMLRGAGGYFALPGDAERLEREIRQRSADGARSAAAAGPPSGRGYGFEGIVGTDPGLKAALDRASRVIPDGRATVLIVGETGTGKELLAQAIHYQGPRSKEPFVAVNCAAIPEALLESELFGHERGAFTDARAAKPGLVQVADGGTLFLDEITTLPGSLQSKLLRFLETGEVRRIGGVRADRVDARIVAAAQEGLRGMVTSGEFRKDLYYRLAVMPVRLPPLRERTGDVPLLARHFLAQLAGEYGWDTPELTAEALATLQRHAWPGNVRELRNAVERAILLAGDGPVRPEHLALEETSTPGEDGGDAVPGSALGSIPFPGPLDRIVESVVRRTVRHCGGNKSEAARRLEIPRSQLYRILQRGESAGNGDRP